VFEIFEIEQVQNDEVPISVYAIENTIKEKVKEWKKKKLGLKNYCFVEERMEFDFLEWEMCL